MWELKPGVNLFVSRQRDAAVGELLTWVDLCLLQYPRERIYCISRNQKVESRRSRVHLTTFDSAPAYVWKLQADERWTTRTDDGQLYDMHEGCADGLSDVADDVVLSRIRSSSWLIGCLCPPTRIVMDLELGDLMRLRVVHEKALKAKVAVVVALTLPCAGGVSCPPTMSECELLVRAAFGFSLKDASSAVYVV